MLREKDRRRRQGEISDGVPFRSFEYVGEAFFNDLNQKQRGSSTLGKRRKTYDDELLPIFRGKSVRAFSSEALGELRDEVLAERGENVWVRWSTILRGISRKAIAIGAIPLVEDPFKSLIKGPTEYTRLIERQRRAAERMKLPSRRQLRRMLEKSTGWLKLALHLIILAGLRRGEVRALLWSGITFDHVQGIVCVHVTKAVKWDGTVGLPKSRKSVRKIHRKGALYDILKAAHPGPGNTHQLIVSYKGAALDTMKLYVSSARFQASIGVGARLRTNGRTTYPGTFRPHLLRHAAVAWWIWEGVPDELIQVWAGHADPVFTLTTYGYLFDSKDAGCKSWPTGSATTGEEISDDDEEDPR